MSGPWIMFGGTPAEHLMVPITGAVSEAMAMPAEVTAPQTDEEKIASITGAGPSVITDNASVLDWPAEKGAKPVQLREGTNGWVCRPDDPMTPILDSRCFDPTYVKLLGVPFGPDREAVNSFGVSYMLNGGNAANNDDPAVITPTVGTDRNKTRHT